MATKETRKSRSRATKKATKKATKSSTKAKGSARSKGAKATTKSAAAKSSKATKNGTKSKSVPTASGGKSKGRERKEIQLLLEKGRLRGFLSYDEINDALPPEMVSSEQIDDLRHAAQRERHQRG